MHSEKRGESMLQLALAVTTFLAPLLPYVMIGTNKAAEEAAKKLGSDVWEKGKDLWGKLYSKENPELKEAAGNMTISPNDTETKEAFTQEVQKSLENDPDLAKEIESLMKDKVIQKVLAENYSEIENVEQEAVSNAIQEVNANNHSSIKGVKMIQKKG